MTTSADDLVAALREMLPGFEAISDTTRDMVAVRGTLTIGASMDVTHLLYLPASDSPEVNRLTALRIAEEAQRRGIEALGLERIIAGRVEIAARRARLEGDRIGYARGVKDGRVAMLNELREAFQDAGLGLFDDRA